LGSLALEGLLQLLFLMISKAYLGSHGLATNRRHLSDISTYRSRPRSCFCTFLRIWGDSVYLHPLVNNTSVDILPQECPTRPFRLWRHALLPCSWEVFQPLPESISELVQ